VLWLRRFVAALLARRPDVDSMPMCVRCAVTIWQVFLRVRPFPLSVSFHQCTMLMFIYMLPYEKGKKGEVCEPPPKKERTFENRELLFFLSLFRSVLKTAKMLLLSSSCPSVYVSPSAWKLPTGRICMEFFLFFVIWKICGEISCFIKILQE